MSELPRMYHNKIDKDLNNNERVFSTLDSNNIYTNSFINNRNNLTVEQKIVNIFNSPNYIYKIDVAKEEELAGAFGIRSIPTLLWIPQSGKPTVTQGALPKPELKKMIDDTLLNSK